MSKPSAEKVRGWAKTGLTMNSPRPGLTVCRLGFNSGWAFEVGFCCSRRACVLTLGWWLVRVNFEQKGVSRH